MKFHCIVAVIKIQRQHISNIKHIRKNIKYKGMATSKLKKKEQPDKQFYLYNFQIHDLKNKYRLPQSLPNTLLFLLHIPRVCCVIISMWVQLASHGYFFIATYPTLITLCILKIESHLAHIRTASWSPSNKKNTAQNNSYVNSLS